VRAEKGRVVTAVRMFLHFLTADGIVPRQMVRAIPKIRRWRYDKGFAFPTVRRTRLSADALNHLLQQAVRRAITVRPDLARKRVTPHVVRHTTALHLLRAGVDIAVIALWLGHESIETTHGYVEADLEMKQRALEKLTPATGTVSRFKAGDSLLQFLSKL
jgi:integrase/recombinase XerD